MGSWLENPLISSVMWYISMWSIFGKSKSPPMGWVSLHFPTLWEKDGVTPVFPNMTKFDRFCCENRRWVRRNQSTVIYIAIELLLFSNNSLWIILAAAQKIFDKTKWTCKSIFYNSARVKLKLNKIKILVLCSFKKGKFF